MGGGYYCINQSAKERRAILEARRALCVSPTVKVDECTTAPPKPHLDTRSPPHTPALPQAVLSLRFKSFKLYYHRGFRLRIKSDNK